MEVYLTGLGTDWMWEEVGGGTAGQPVGFQVENLSEQQESLLRVETVEREQVWVGGWSLIQLGHVPLQVQVCSPSHEVE